MTGTTPLFAAVELHTTEMYPERKPRRTPGGAAGTLELIRVLLASGADPDARLTRGSLRWGRGHNAGDGALTEGSTPLMRAARFGDVAAMRALLEAGADPAATQTDGTTVLMLAAGAGWRTGETILGGTDYGEESDAIEAVTLCLKRGADVHAADADGLTALHHAVVRGSGVVRLLVEQGAGRSSARASSTTFRRLHLLRDRLLALRGDDQPARAGEEPEGAPAFAVHEAMKRP